MPLSLQRRDTDDTTDEEARDRDDGQGPARGPQVLLEERRGDLARDQHRGDVGTDREEGGVAERELARVAGDQVQAGHRDGDDQGIGEEALARTTPLRRGAEDEEPDAAEQEDAPCPVLPAATGDLERQRHQTRSTFSEPNRPVGRNSRTPSRITNITG